MCIRDSRSVSVCRDGVEMPGQQGIELLRRLFRYPVADTIEHLVRIRARDEAWGERSPLRSDRLITVAPHIQSGNGDLCPQSARTREHHRPIPVERATGGAAVAHTPGIACGRLR